MTLLLVLRLGDEALVRPLVVVHHARRREAARRPRPGPRAGSSASICGMQAAISSIVSTTSPPRPCSTTSGTAPRRVASTGVPQAIDSTITSPNGSGHWIGNTVTARPLEQLDLLVVRHLADVLDVVAQVRAHGRVEVLVLDRVVDLAGQLQRQPRLAGDPHRVARALVGRHPAQEQQVAVVPGVDRVARRGRWRCGRWRASSARAAGCAGSRTARSAARAGDTRAIWA